MSIAFEHLFADLEYGIPGFIVWRQCEAGVRYRNHLFQRVLVQQDEHVHAWSFHNSPDPDELFSLEHHDDHEDVTYHEPCGECRQYGCDGNSCYFK